MKKNFEVLFMPEAIEFLEDLERAVKEKILKNIEKAQMTRDPELFKKLSGEMWEFRTKYENQNYRLLAFWSREQRALVISTHGFIKKTVKTPKKEIKKGKNIRDNYLSGGI
ncbi:MAG: addiction module toxin RelE [Bacteroidetes bacterium GWF2_42_66]|nr:MAG: addiction module toxin RelE [Bacteroidetes bacterium GWA2_42_15]OFY01484.1 MAG: addiction module toxin RelE [Bacteroidetes bacterium GWE2_42_39]OFY43335.1 MAG: addiction module toxin RelE [Bacteroidetes bacterium GWF2_42_66]HBL77482.1 hypothetical protein [Prolixibacteraceae bacterium]HCR91293.1 hypothetical protein [Prolixibacteraceae bacterium]